MSVTNTWVVEQMDCYPTYESQTDVVFTVHWRLNATDGTYNATAYGTVGVTYVDDMPYTSYADLTQEQVVQWVHEAFGAEEVKSIEENLAANIVNQITPPVVTLALPWSV